MSTQTFKVGAPSLFVETTAWVAIVLAVLASGSALVQNAEVASALPAWREGRDPLLPLSRLRLDYLSWVMGAAVVLSAALLAQRFTSRPSQRRPGSIGASSAGRLVGCHVASR